MTTITPPTPATPDPAIAEIDAIVLQVLRKERPGLVVTLDDLLRHGQEPAAIMQVVRRNPDVSPLLYTMIEGAIRALQSEHAQEAHP